MTLIDPTPDPIKEEAEALDRIARTHDGALLHRHLRRILETVCDFQDVGTLQTQNGRRSLARDLMRLMAEGIEGSSDRSGTDPILTRSSSSGAGSSRPRGVARRVGPSEPYTDDTGSGGTSSPGGAGTS